MLIILEGPDGSGKTTLAKELIDQGCHYQHMTYRWPNKMVQYQTACFMHNLKKALDTNTPVVIDRWWISDMIYAKVFRGGSPWPHYGRMLDRMLLSYGGIYVMCQPGTPEEYKVRFKKLADERKEMYTDINKMAEVYDDYTDLFYGSACNKSYEGYLGVMMKKGMCYRQDCLKYDYLSEGGKVKKIAARLKENVLRNYAHQNFPTFHNQTAGNFCADTIVLGDKPNLKWNSGRPDWPFFENANCSLHLAKTLDELGVDEAHTFYVNINHPITGISHIQSWLHHKTRPIRVITLGNDAEVTYLKNFCGSNSYIPAPHPQAARRFPFNQGKFISKLKEGLC